MLWTIKLPSLVVQPVILTESTCYGIWRVVISTRVYASKQKFYRKLVFAASTVEHVALKTLVAVVLENGQDAAIIEITVLGDQVDGQILADFRDGQELRHRFNSFFGQATDTIPELAIARGATLCHGRLNTYLIFLKIILYLCSVVDSILGIIVLKFFLLENT